MLDKDMHAYLWMMTTKMLHYEKIILNLVSILCSDSMPSDVREKVKNNPMLRRYSRLDEAQKKVLMEFSEQIMGMYHLDLVQEEKECPLLLPEQPYEYFGVPTEKLEENSQKNDEFGQFWKEMNGKEAVS